MRLFSDDKSYYGAIGKYVTPVVLLSLINDCRPSQSDNSLSTLIKIGKILLCSKVGSLVGEKIGELSDNQKSLETEVEQKSLGFNR